MKYEVGTLAIDR